MKQTWESKHRPKDVSEIIGQEPEKKQFENWIKDFENPEKQLCSNIMILGPTGSGKSLLVDLMLEKYNYDPIIITSTNIKEMVDPGNKKTTTKTTKTVKSSKNIDNPLNHFLINSNNLQTLINAKKTALVIADTEKISLAKEKTMLVSLCKNNTSKPIIFIGTDQHSKLIDDLRKNTIVINLNIMSEKDLKKYIKNIVEIEKLSFENSSDIDNIITFCKSNIKMILGYLEELKEIYRNKTITHKDCKSFFKNIVFIDNSLQIYDNTREILDKYVSIDKVLTVYEQNKSLLPLMICQNYINNLDHRQCSVKQYYDSLENMSYSFVKGDLLTTNIYTDQNWYLQKFYGFYTCCETTFELSKYKLKSNNYTLTFANGWTDTTIGGISKKNINKVYMTANKKLNDSLILNKLIEMLVIKQKYYKIKRLFESYNLDKKELAELISNIYKIDKTSNKTILKTKQLNFFKQLL